MEELNSTRNDTCNTQDTSHDPVSLFHFLVMGVGAGLVSVMGIIGNTLSAIVLSRPKMKSSLNCLLLGLTFCDMLLILNTLIIFSIATILEYFGVGQSYGYFNTLLTPYLYSLGMTGKSRTQI